MYADGILNITITDDVLAVVVVFRRLHHVDVRRENIIRECMPLCRR